ncbi:glycoside hydrolase family 172 protein [Maribellus maritimus]|uniref:glycoside hydrolase family 172 protein n=1 Tax=Maribellus maritimus TaxID=2870838 RepID=UPI001EEB9F40|nr:glycoside hydrolase family 172 protein [Maribellus maritimus]MCG6189549.1 DUF2961 domain-containing protein [Maribellus maritimus]
MNRTVFLLGTLISIALVSCKTKVVTLESLLDEMTDKTVLTRFPEEKYALKQFSSYDRKSVSPDDNNWWANADYTQFIREEENNGRREFVLFDAEGPGAVVRYWMTFAGDGASAGILRIYIDGSEMPEVEGNVLEILSGTQLAPEPLAASVSPETEYERRGHNLYLPIPYAKHCKITYECDAVRLEDERWRPSIYYNICYRVYAQDVDVESFSKKVLARAKNKIEGTAQKLLIPDSVKGEMINDTKILQPGDEFLLGVSEDGKAISKMTLKLKTEDLNQALRSTVLSMSFDGIQSVWTPVGDFWGTGYQVYSSKTWYSQVESGGEMVSFWIMPFQKNAEVRFVNYGEQSVEVEAGITISDYNWTRESMYFGASWHELNRIHTAKDSILENHEWHFDVNYIDINGQGVYAGDALTIFNTADAWWGEGDEKIFVDGESFPSFIGTGTEDYYGYAWCRPEKFTHPFIAQPTGAGNFHSGMTVNMRYRALDAIPFNKKISSNIELWHWVKTRINYAMTAYWYAKPGFTINIKPNIESVKIPVALKRSDIYKPIVDSEGKIEGENLEIVNITSGEVGAQTGDYGWSGNSQLWWRNAEKGAELTTKFIVSETAKYKVKIQLTKAVDYGIIQLYLNGVVLHHKINVFNRDKVVPFEIDLGMHVLSEGENIFSLKILGADKNAKPGNMAGIDFIRFQKI